MGCNKIIKMTLLKDLEGISATFMDAVGNRLLVIDEYAKPVIEESLKSDFVKNISASCGFDPDSVLFLSKPKEGDILMRIFDRDGTEETMCGNGVRCIARYAREKGYIGDEAAIVTLDGIKQTQISADDITTNFGKIRGYQDVGARVHFAYSGLPHLVVFTDNLDSLDTESIARAYRYDLDITVPLGYPENMHVNLVELIDRNTLKIKTYEACVERITQACGTGAVASAYVAEKSGKCDFPVKVINPGGILIVDNNKDDLTLTGPAEIVGETKYICNEK